MLSAIYDFIGVYTMIKQQIKVFRNKTIYELDLCLDCGSKLEVALDELNSRIKEKK